MCACSGRSLTRLQKSGKRAAAQSADEAARKERKTQAGEAKAARAKRLVEGSPARDGGDAGGEFVIRSTVNKRAKTDQDE